MRIVHLTASTFFGGPERQMLGLAESLPPEYHTTFLSFREGGRCDEFLQVVRDAGFDAKALQHDTPHLRAAVRELTAFLRDEIADVLVCHGYKANILGRIAARRGDVPVVSVSRGWTWENWKVRVYTALDQWHLKYMDHVVCVSEGQAAKVRLCGVEPQRMSVIPNSARLNAFTEVNPSFREKLHACFPSDSAVSRIVVTAGRLSPEKGFDVLIEAAASVLRDDPGAGFVLFGEGDERRKLEDRIRELRIGDRFRMPGFTKQLDSYLPHADLVVLSSFSEGLPNVLLEASAAGVPIVATDVGGVPEVVANGHSGYLVPPGNAAALATRMTQLLWDSERRRAMGEAGRQRMHDLFTFEAQGRAYLELFEKMIPRAVARAV